MKSLFPKFKIEVFNRNFESGMTLVEILVAIGIASGLAMAIGYSIFEASKQNRKQEISQQLLEYRAEIIAAIKSDSAFAHSMSQNPLVFDCILNKKNCRDSSGEFIVFDAQNRRVETTSLTSEANRGFSSGRIRCDSYSATGGSDGCPFKFVARWRAVCGARYDLASKSMVDSDTICLNPTVLVNVDFSFAPRDRSAFPVLVEDRLNIVLVRSQVESDPSVLCGMVGGNLVPESTVRDRVGSCVQSIPTSIDCIQFCEASGSRNFIGYVVGFDANGAPICGCDLQVSTDCNVNPTDGRVLGNISDNGQTVNCAGGVITDLRNTGNLGEPTTTAPWLRGVLPPSLGGDGGGGAGGGS